MSDIYDQHEAAFARVSAYAIAKDGARVGTVAFKYPADGAGRLYAYVHWLGEPMVRGFAGGYGYDKRSAACSVAARKLTAPSGLQDDLGAANLEASDWHAFRKALAHDGGATWERELERAGFTVWQAV